MLQAHLIVNPSARAVTPSQTRAVAAALAGVVHLDVSVTASAGAAVSQARSAARGGADVVIAFGGDGLVNGVVNGLVGTEAALGVVPGGTMNVFARSLGAPRGPIEAARRLAERIGGGDVTRVDLGRANGRFFTFSCGSGFDAEAAARVEGHRRAKHRLGEPYFYAAAVTTLVASYAVRSPFLRCDGPFTPRRAVMAIALTGRPYAYLAGRPVRLGRGARPSEGLSLFVVPELRVWRMPGYALGVLGSGRFGPGAELIEGLPSLTISSARPFAAHVDGEGLEPSDRVELEYVASALPVVG
ncbi:MAG: diacylglycerol/lipid kinase family protein [Actinomycetota bacterium]